MVEVSEKLSLLAETVKRKMEHFAIPDAEMDSMVLDQSVGNTVHLSSEMMALSASSPSPMEEV